MFRVQGIRNQAVWRIPRAARRCGGGDFGDQWDKTDESAWTVHPSTCPCLAGPWGSGAKSPQVRGLGPLLTPSAPPAPPAQ